MYHIVINENGNYSKEFSTPKLPTVGDKLRLQLKDSDAPPEIFQVTRVGEPRPGCSGRFNYEIMLKKLARPRSKPPLIVVEECH